MCIIAAKPAGTEMPKYKYLENMFDNNNDGAGLMYAHKGRVYIEKGFMKEYEFFDRLSELDDEFGLKNLPLVMHFRITTHGGTKPENCHPFPVTDSMGMLKKLKCSTDLGVAHNGIIKIDTRSKDISDTMEYIAGQLAPLKRAVPNFYRNPDLMEMVYNAISSRMCLMNGAGEMFFIGDFQEEKGVKYSNSSYKHSWNFRDFSYSSKGILDTHYSDYAPYGCEYYIKELMWLESKQGDYIRLRTGEFYDGDEFAIDENLTVYYYDNDLALFVPADAEAFNSEGVPLKYENENHWITDEYVILEDYYE